MQPLIGLTRLFRLYAERNQVADLTPLARLTSLTRLRLTGNQVTDLSPLFGLSDLRTVSMRDNPLSQEAIDEQIPALAELGIAVAF